MKSHPLPHAAIHNHSIHSSCPANASDISNSLFLPCMASLGKALQFTDCAFICGGVVLVCSDGWLLLIASRNAMKGLFWEKDKATPLIGVNSPTRSITITRDLSAFPSLANPFVHCAP